jgi:hypothetical protein
MVLSFKTFLTERMTKLFIDVQTLLVIILVAFIVGLVVGIRLTRPRYDRY